MKLEDLLEQYPLSTVDRADFRQAVVHFVSGTHLEGQLEVNPTSGLVPGKLNVFFTDFSSPEIWQPFTSTCLHSHGKHDTNIILYDTNFLTHIDHAFANPNHPTGARSVVSSPEVAAPSEEAQKYEQIFLMYFQNIVSTCFPFWVIGHEVGHAVLCHRRNALEYDNGELVETSREPREQEVEADLFVIEKMSSEPRWSIDFFQMLTHLLNHWVAVETGITAVELGNLGYTGPFIEITDDSWTHPTMVVRLLNMLDAYLRRFPSVDTTGYFTRVRSKLAITRRS